MEFKLIKGYYNKIVPVNVSFKPCPFCGSNNIKATGYNTGNGGDDFSGFARIECEDCEAQIKQSSTDIAYRDNLKNMLENVINKWNKRI